MTVADYIAAAPPLRAERTDRTPLPPADLLEAAIRERLVSGPREDC